MTSPSRPIISIKGAGWRKRLVAGKAFLPSRWIRCTVWPAYTGSINQSSQSSCKRSLKTAKSTILTVFYSKFWSIIIIITIIVQWQLMHELVTKNFEPENIRTIAWVRGSPLWYPVSNLLHWNRTLKELRTTLRLLGMTLTCAWMILHLGSGVVYLRGNGYNPKACCWWERPNSCQKFICWAEILVEMQLDRLFSLTTVQLDTHIPSNWGRNNGMEIHCWWDDGNN